MTVDFAPLAAALRGELITPAQEDKYKEQRFRGWNNEPSRRFEPLAFVLVAGTHDIVRAVQFCSAQKIPVTIRGKGAHSHWGMASGAVCIDLTKMDAVRIDAAKKLAYIQAGATGRDVDDETSLHDLVCPAGTISHTGFAGPCLGGGMSHLSRWLGTICDNVVEFEMVTADGKVIRVNDKEHPDLFWALRGSGNSTFGIVTEIVVKLTEMPNKGLIYGAPIIWPLDKATEVIKEYLQFIGTDHKRTHAFQFALMFGPDGGEVCAVVPCIVGETDADAKAICDEIASWCGGAVHRDDQVLPYVAFQQALDALFPYNMNYWDKGAFLDYDPNNVTELAEILVQIWKNKASNCAVPSTIQLLLEVNGAVADADPASTSFVARNSRLWLATIAAWEDGDDYEDKLAAGKKWTREATQAVASYQRNNYINGAMPNTEEELLNVYPDLPRLKDIKNKYDPEGLFTAGSWNVKLNV